MLGETTKRYTFTGGYGFIRSLLTAHSITTLEPKYREVLWLYYYDELSITDIASILQCSVNTVKTRLARGRKRVGIQLEKEGFYNGNEFT